MATKRRMSAFLPPTPCTQDMRTKLVAVAEEQGKSIAQVQREAVSLFLSGFNTYCIETAPDRIREQEQAS